MNQNQKTVIFIALILLLCCGIFVPYDGTETYLNKTYDMYRTEAVTTMKANSFIGYFPIFNPPSKRDMYKSFYPDYENDLAPNYEVRRESGDLNNEIRRKILGKPALPVFNSKEEYVENKIDNILKSSSMTYESNINLSRLIIQIFILLIITIGLVLLFADSRHKEKPISKKEV